MQFRMAEVSYPPRARHRERGAPCRESRPDFVSPHLAECSAPCVAASPLTASASAAAALDEERDGELRLIVTSRGLVFTDAVTMTMCSPSKSRMVRERQPPARSGRG
jgi:hypothetical protein